MSTYAIGDVQGCFDSLQKLLDKIEFDPKQDQLWFTGDLVNRGPQSLETLRFVKNLGNQCITVLGNHDLHLLAKASGNHPGWEEDTLDDILKASDRDELLHWLSHQPLLHHQHEFVLVHAGLAANWDLMTAKKLAAEVEDTLKNPDKAHEFYKHMYGNQPNHWDENLTGWDRLRTITNYFTRARFCYTDGSLEFDKKGKLETHSSLIPWFKLENPGLNGIKILFGHWAALGGVTNTPNKIALDTGCVWGYCLTALRLEDGERFSVRC